MTSRLKITAHPPNLLDVGELLSFWNTAQPDDLHATARLFEWWQGGCATGEAMGAVLQLRRGDLLVGAGLVSRLTQPDASVADGPIGWVDAMALAPGPKRSADRTRLLRAAHEQLRSWGCRAAVAGGGPLSLARGGPELDRAGAFSRDALAEPIAPVLYDMTADVARYHPPAELPPLAGVVRPAQPRDRDEIEALIARPLLAHSAGVEASAAHLFTIRRILESGRLADLMLLRTYDGVTGLTQLAFADSVWPVELVYPWSLPRPWAALPALFTRPATPDSAVLALLDSALRRLHNNGVNSCVAPGIHRTALYERAGFVRGRSWRPYSIRLKPAA